MHADTTYRLKSFWGLIQKELRHIVRDRRTLTVLLAMPIVQVLLFGFAIQTDVEDVRLVVVDPAPSTRSMDLRARFDASTTYRIVGVERHTRALDRYFERGRADQALVVPPDFSRSVASVDGAELLVITGTPEPTTGRSIEAYARAVIQQYEREERLRTQPPIRVAAETRFRFNETLESQNIFVPGLLAFILTIVSALMTAITLSREKESGTLEVLLVSPLRSIDIILGKVLPYLVLAFLNALTTLAVAFVVFKVPFRGSLALLLGESLLFVFACLALGVFIATRAPDQRSAQIGVLLGTMLPTAIFSGMIFPIASMPDWLQPITYLVPARWFVEVARTIMLKDASLVVLWQETTVLVVMALVLLTVSIRSFSERLA